MPTTLKRNQTMPHFDSNAVKLNAGSHSKMLKGNDSKASYETNTLNLKVGFLHEALLAYFNDMHEARATYDLGTMEELEQIVPALLDEFEATECRKTENPLWLACKMRAGWQMARGDFQSALKFELDGYRHADEERASPKDSVARNHRRAVSASNIADQLWRLQRAKEGLTWARHSVELWPANSINHLVLAITAYHAGLKKEANNLLGQLLTIASYDERNLLFQVMSFERELQIMVDLPNVQNLLKNMRQRI